LAKGGASASLVPLNLSDRTAELNAEMLKVRSLIPRQVIFVSETFLQYS